MSIRKKTPNKRLRKTIKTDRQLIVIAYDSSMRDCYRPYAVIDGEVLSLPAMVRR